ncbi:peptidylprolyl isomerase [Blattabacterium cuenoti]|uniref:peptidylprolyl isomerase n=1 Tax=Blattabacterium cuenoti TaxID=1653831 RepID=UPI001EEC35B5|nr:peptidylprolyl isomerase [Blattabacterium cuenoti]
MLIIFFVSSSSFTLEKIGGITAVIGDEILLDSEVKHYLNSNKKILPCKGLENLIIHKLILYHSKKDPSLQIDNQEIQYKKEEFLKGFNSDSSKNLSLEELTETIKNNQYIEKFYQKIKENIEITPEEVKHFFNKEKEKLPIVPKQICVSYIILSPKFSKEHREKIMNFLKKIKNEIHSDKDFSTKAILLSEDYSSAFKGGLINGIKKKNISKEFEKIVFSLEEKQISEPFETDLGFHLVKLEKKRGEEIDIRHILIQPKYTEEELRRAKSFAYEIKNRLINHEISFETISNERPLLHNEIVNHSVWKKIWVEENQISKNLKKTLKNLKNGEISKPYKEIVNGKEFFFIVKLLKRKPSHPISFQEDYTQLKNLVMNIKQEEKIKNWIKNQLKKTYLRIEYPCPIQDNKK